MVRAALSPSEQAAKKERRRLAVQACRAREREVHFEAQAQRAAALHYTPSPTLTHHWPIHVLPFGMNTVGPAACQMPSFAPERSLVLQGVTLATAPPRPLQQLASAPAPPLPTGSHWEALPFERLPGLATPLMARLGEGQALAELERRSTAARSTPASLSPSGAQPMPHDATMADQRQAIGRPMADQWQTNGRPIGRPMADQWQTNGMVADQLAHEPLPQQPPPSPLATGPVVVEEPTLHAPPAPAAALPPPPPPLLPLYPNPFTGTDGGAAAPAATRTPEEHFVCLLDASTTDRAARASVEPSGGTVEPEAAAAAAEPSSPAADERDTPFDGDDGGFEDAAEAPAPTPSPSPLEMPSVAAPSTPQAGCWLLELPFPLFKMVVRRLLADLTWEDTGAWIDELARASKDLVQLVRAAMPPVERLASGVRLVRCGCRAQCRGVSSLSRLLKQQLLKQRMPTHAQLTQGPTTRGGGGAPRLSQPWLEPHAGVAQAWQGRGLSSWRLAPGVLDANLLEAVRSCLDQLPLDKQEVREGGYWGRRRNVVELKVPIPERITVRAPPLHRTPRLGAAGPDPASRRAAPHPPLTAPPDGHMLRVRRGRGRG